MKKYIKSVDVKGLWFVKNIHISLFDDVNILIGGNGSGKTTFLHLVEALLNLEFTTIDDIEFEEVKIVIQTEVQTETLIVQRLMEDLISPLFRYEFSGGEVVDIRPSEGRGIYRNRLESRRLFVHLRDRLDELVNVSWLSINRISESTDRADRRMMELARTDVDLKLSQLMNKIISYRLQLETNVNERTKKFNEDLVSLLLYNDAYDAFPSFEKIKEFMSYSKDDIIRELHKVYSYFGDARVHTDDIKQHVEKVVHIVDKIDTHGSFSPEEMLSLSLMSRTVAILKLSSDYQAERAQILEPIKTYIDILSQYLKDKKMEFDTSSSKLIPHVMTGNGKYRALDVSALSSGEKQILILLTETLLQQNKPFIFMADEPELSLHIEWQRNLITSIRSLNPNAQIIFATHAPEIAANHSKKIINMLSVTNYGE